MEITIQNHFPNCGGIGINLEFGKRPTWIMFPFFTIIIIRPDFQELHYYLNDFYRLKKKIFGFFIYKHYEPEKNDKYFCLGLDNDTLFIGNYTISKKKQKANLPVIDGVCN